MSYALLQSLAPIMVFLFMAGGGLLGPSTQLGDARNAQRRSDVNTILNATYQYAIDNNGELPGNIPTADAKEICPSADPVEPCVDLHVFHGTYLVSIPRDPEAPEGHTWYSIVQSKDGRITVTAMRAENGAAISVTR